MSNDQADPKAEAMTAVSASDSKGFVAVRELYDEARRDMAMKRPSLAADKLARVLEQLQEEAGVEQNAPVLAPILHLYGKAVLSLAVNNSGALGGGGTNAEDGAEPALTAPKKKASAAGSEKEAAAAAKPSDPRFSFGGDGDDGEEDEEEEEEDGEAAAGQGEEDDDDDFGLAFTVLDLARVIYEKLLDKEQDEASLTTYEGETLDAVSLRGQLAEVYNDLGDVGLESENFQQASSDYEQSLKVISPLLHLHSRRLADAQLRLGLALEFHPDAEQRPRAAEFVQAASDTLQRRLETIEAREKALQEGAGGDKVPEVAQKQIDTVDVKGKGKAKRSSTNGLVEKDEIATMDLSGVEKEKKDVKEMIEELRLKLEEYQHDKGKDGSTNAIGLPGGIDRAALEKAINDAFLGASTNVFGAPTLDSSKPVNDLSSMVKKKKVPATGADMTGKRKAEESIPTSAVDSDANDSKKAKTG